jgi:hypothetical protein
MKRLIFGVGSIVFLLTFTYLALAAFPGDSIIVEYADNMETNTLSGSTTLFGLLNNVAPRIALQYSDKLRHNTLSAPPTALITNLNAVAARIGLQYADRVRQSPLVVIPPALSVRLSETSDRIIFQYPDKNRPVALSYPAALIGDTTPPTIVGTPGANMSANSAIITWTTNEFTTYVLHYGTSSGSYPNQVSSSLFSKEHRATLTGLNPSETYYYQIVSTDLSGNQAASQEYVLEGQYYIFLPMTRR